MYGNVINHTLHQKFFFPIIIPYMYIHEKYTSSIYLDFNAKTNQSTISIKGEWDTSIIWHTSFWNKKNNFFLLTGFIFTIHDSQSVEE